MHNEWSVVKIDLLKSMIIHGIILIGIGISCYIPNRKVVLNLKLVNSSTEVQPIKANLIDHKELQQAVKRQEKVFLDKIAKERKLEQQEQKITKLTTINEQEAKKLKQERDYLKKEQENLQKTVHKLKQQQQELTNQQTKLEQLKKEYLKKKKVIENNNNASETELQRYHNKMYTKIINNRKVTTLFPENLECIIKVKILSNGQLDIVKLEKSSGDSAYDAFSEQAIHKSAPFEMPEDPKLNKELVEIEHEFIFTDR